VWQNFWANRLLQPGITPRMSSAAVHSVPIYDEHSSLIKRLCGVGTADEAAIAAACSAHSHVLVY